MKNKVIFTMLMYLLSVQMNAYAEMFMVSGIVLPQITIGTQSCTSNDISTNQFKRNRFDYTRFLLNKMNNMSECDHKVNITSGWCITKSGKACHELGMPAPIRVTITDTCKQDIDFLKKDFLERSQPQSDFIPNYMDAYFIATANNLYTTESDRKELRRLLDKYLANKPIYRESLWEELNNQLIEKKQNKNISIFKQDDVS